MLLAMDCSRPQMMPVLQSPRTSSYTISDDCLLFPRPVAYVLYLLLTLCLSLSPLSQPNLESFEISKSFLLRINHVQGHLVQDFLFHMYCDCVSLLLKKTIFPYDHHYMRFSRTLLGCGVCAWPGMYVCLGYLYTNSCFLIVIQ